MSIQSLSFWQQDRNFWQSGQAASQSASAEDSLINVMGQAETNLGKGLAAIANGAALNRVQSQLTAEIQNLLQGSGSGTSNTPSTSTASTTSSGSSNASPSASSTPSTTPATGTGTVPVTTGTSLSSLGILPGGTITVGTGANTTTYTSTGTDTVGDLLNAINLDLPTNANVTAKLGVDGQLVITSRDTKSAIFIGGSGTDAAAIGFGLGHNTFLPKTAASSSTTSSSTSSSSANSSSSSTAGSTASSTTSTNSAKTAVPSYLALAEQNVTAAEGVLSGAGASGSLVNLLA